MQFYKFEGFTVSEKWSEENDNRRVMREKVRKISMKTNSFNQNQQRKAYVRNIIEKAKMAQASRLLAMDFDSIVSDDIALITAEDIEIPKTCVKTEKRRIGFCV